MRLFLDTSVLISALRGRTMEAHRLLISSNHELLTNEYAIKECRRVLEAYFGLSMQDIDEAVMIIRRRCIVNKTPSPEKYVHIKIRDRSDIPIVYGALIANCILVTDDEVTYRDAKKYLESLRSEEVPI
jgi:predicted nucleic acid-binding protein